MKEVPICKIYNCHEPECNSRGMCWKHYMRWRRHGDALAGKTFDGEPMRWLKDVALKYDGNDCLSWPFGRDGNGRGKIYIDGKNALAHRFICEAINGPPPSERHEAAHDCGKGNEGCVNPHHLFWKTPTENQRDRVKHGTHLRGSKNPRSKLTESDVRRIRELDGKLLHRDIAARYGVSRGLVTRIINRVVWVWLDRE